MEGTGLGIALMSYDGKLHVGLNADYEMVPDLGIFTALVAQAFMAISDAAEEKSTQRPTPIKKKTVPPEGAKKNAKPRSHPSPSPESGPALSAKPARN